MIKYCILRKKRKDGRYQAYAYIGGTPRQYLYDISKSDLKIKLNELVERLEMGITDSNMKVDTLIIQWLEIHCSSLSPTTLNEYKTYCKNYIDEKFKNKKVLDIMPSDIQILLNRLGKEISKRTHKPLSEKTLKNMRGILSSIFSFALKNRKIKFNPCIGITINKTEEYKYYIYSVEEMTKLFEYLETGIEAIPVVLASLCGMRMSEILGLNWNDIDFKNKTITIKKACVHVGSEVILRNTTKTKTSTRTISICDYAMKILELNRGLGIVYSSSAGTRENGRNYGKRFSSMLKHAGFRHTRFHDLRHFTATTLLDEGIADKFISEFLGHSNTNMTKKYQHVMNDKKHFVADTFNKLIK